MRSHNTPSANYGVWFNQGEISAICATTAKGERTIQGGSF